MGVDVKYLKIVGGYIYVVGNDDTTNLFVPSVSNHFIPANPTAPPPPPPPTGTTIQQALVDWMLNHIGAYAYSQAEGRLYPDVSGFTDCSGLMHYCYLQVAGIETGTWTGDEQNYGTLITDSVHTIDESMLVIGDLIFFDWGSYTAAWDHVEMYIGGNQTCGHGKPGVMGPQIHSLSDNVAYASRVRARRYV